MRRQAKADRQLQAALRLLRGVGYAAGDDHRRGGGAGGGQAAVAQRSLHYAGSCTVIVVPRPTSLSTSIVPLQLSTSRFTIASPSPDPLVVVENRGSKIRGSSSAGIPAPSSDTLISPGPTRTSNPLGARVARVLQQVHHDFLHLVRARRAERAAARCCSSHLAALLRQPVELDHLTDRHAEVDPVERLLVARGRGEPAERARDGVEPVDLRQHPLRGLLQRPVELASPVAIDPPQVLHARAASA